MNDVYLLMSELADDPDNADESTFFESIELDQYHDYCEFGPVEIVHNAKDEQYPVEVLCHMPDGRTIGLTLTAADVKKIASYSK